MGTHQRLREWQRELAAVRLHDIGPEGAVSWIVAEPLLLAPSLIADLVRMGEDIRKFLLMCSDLLREPAVRQRVEGSLSPTELASVSRWACATGFPMLMRPDLVLDDAGKPHIAEIDLQPAHAGVLQRMQEISGQTPTIASIWAETFSGPTVVSVPQWKPFCSEQRYFAERVRAAGGDLEFVPVEEWGRLEHFEGRLFKNCCTLDLLRPDYPAFLPPRAILCPELLLDWKGWMALAGEIGGLAKSGAARWIPESLLLPLHPRLYAQRRRDMLDLSRAEKDQWVIKPLGSWGGRGFAIGETYSRDEWNSALLGLGPEDARNFLLQRKVESRRFSVTGLTPDGDVVQLDRLKMRLGPYYVMTPERSRLAGILVTLRHSTKVHTSRDAVHVLALPGEESVP